MNTFPPRSASSATSPRSVKWQRAPAASRDWPRQDVGLVTADLTRRPAARLANSPTHLITELAATQKRFAAATIYAGSRHVQRLVTMYPRPDQATVGVGDRRDGVLLYPNRALGPTAQYTIRRNTIWPMKK